MERRNVIRALGGGATAVLMGDLGRAEAQSGPGRNSSAVYRKPTLAFSSYGMRMLPVRDAIREIANAGFKAMEITVMPTWPTEPKLLSRTDRVEIRKEIGDRGMILTSIQESLQLADPNTLGNPNYTKPEKLEHLRVAAELAHELSPGAPALIETALGGRTATWEEMKAGMADELASWAKTLEPLKTVLAIKAFVGSVIDRPERVLWLLEKVRSPWIRCGYDYSHLKLLGLGLRDTILQVARYMVFVHVKDSVGSAENYHFLLPGDSGEINYGQYAQVLKDVGYRGPVVVEVSVQVSGQAGYNPVAAARHSFQNLSPYFG